MGTIDAHNSKTDTPSRLSKSMDTFTPKGKLFRSKKLDYNKPLSIYRESNIDLDENMSSMLRPVPLVATGVDKEEEEEHHLKVILETAPTSASANVHIPIPEADESIIPYYSELYPPTFKLSKQYYKAPPPPRWFRPIDDSIASTPLNSSFMSGKNLVGFGFGAKAPLHITVESGMHSVKDKHAMILSRIFYSASEEDVHWVDQINANFSKPLLDIDLFEKTFWILELLSHVYGWETLTDTFLYSELAVPYIDKWINDDEWKILTQINKPFFDYWYMKKQRVNGLPLIATLKLEDDPKSNSIDPYVCFRRREVRPVRKTRRSDAQSLEKLRKLRTHFADIFEMLNMTVERDRLKKEALLSDMTIFKNTLQLEEWVRKYNISLKYNIIPSKSSTSATSKPFTLPKIIRAIVPQSEDSAFDLDEYIKLTDTSHKRLSFLARLFGLRKTYRDIRRIYHRSNLRESLMTETINVTSPIPASTKGGDEGIPHEDHYPMVIGPPAFSTFSPWISYFNPIEVSRMIEKDLQKKKESQMENRFFFDYTEKHLKNPIQSNKTGEYSDYFYRRSNPMICMRYRRGRGGRLVIDRQYLSNHKMDLGSTSDLRAVETTISSIEKERILPSHHIPKSSNTNILSPSDFQKTPGLSLTPRDYTSLLPAAVGNYNTHVFELTKSYLGPLSMSSKLIGHWTSINESLLSHASHSANLNTTDESLYRKKQADSREQSSLIDASGLKSGSSFQFKYGNATDTTLSIKISSALHTPAATAATDPKSSLKKKRKNSISSSSGTESTASTSGTGLKRKIKKTRRKSLVQESPSQTSRKNVVEEKNLGEANGRKLSSDFQKPKQISEESHIPSYATMMASRPQTALHETMEILNTTSLMNVSAATTFVSGKSKLLGSSSSEFTPGSNMNASSHLYVNPNPFSTPMKNTRPPFLLSAPGSGGTKRSPPQITVKVRSKNVNGSGTQNLSSTTQTLTDSSTSQQFMSESLSAVSRNGTTSSSLFHGNENDYIGKEIGQDSLGTSSILPFSTGDGNDSISTVKLKRSRPTSPINSISPDKSSDPMMSKKSMKNI